MCLLHLSVGVVSEIHTAAWRSCLDKWVMCGQNEDKAQRLSSASSSFKRLLKQWVLSSHLFTLPAPLLPILPSPSSSSSASPIDVE